MSDPLYVKALAQAGVFYIPLVVTQSSALSRTLWLIGRDLDGAGHTAQVRKNRGVGSPILDLTTVTLESEDVTWSSLVTDGIISYVPHGVLPEDITAVTSIQVAATQSEISQAYAASGAALTENAVMEWELVVNSAQPYTLCAATFTITPGINS